MKLDPDRNNFRIKRCLDKTWSNKMKFVADKTSSVKIILFSDEYWFRYLGWVTARYNLVMLALSHQTAQTNEKQLRY